MKAGKFSFKIVSTDTAARTIVLIPGSFRVAGLKGATWGTNEEIHYHDPAAIIAAGHSIDFVLDDGQIDETTSKVTCTALNSKYSIEHFLEYIKTYPQRCNEVVIQANNTDQFSEFLSYAQDNPLQGQGVTDIPLSDYFSNRQFQDDKIVIPANLILSKLTLMYITIPGGGRTTTISFNKLSPM